MDESMGSARALRTTSLLVAATGVVLLCVGLIMVSRVGNVTQFVGAGDSLDGFLRATGVVAVFLGTTALVVAVIMNRLSRRIMREALALRKLARHMVAEAQANGGQVRQPDVPAWALRTPHAPSAGRDEASDSHSPVEPARASTPQADDESPAERTDTWAAIDAMRAGERDRRKKSA